MQAQALAAVAGAVAAGDPERAGRLATDAETAARSITDPAAQAQTLAAVAEAVAAAGDYHRAGNLLGVVLAVRSWQVPLPVLAKYWPRVVLRFVDELSGNERPRYT
ncbi:hypothetical protein [Couchioplanes caeruleus]|uniref:Uncharacterized protein n=2 Tax=Couchioplanes caeruleus TaxID=56438 RepID=A0A1K0FKH7_9ACTN|nr:hypothetical protein [Couchioplanes caeruleus]OJF13359.1 hypothetical protein BG844_15665 [Couchioplanes caeruleus subsp. caeruleus]ROP33572.1 hypothetical protein EDD30_6569 [Couchioplanes caeruleus]